MENKSNELSDYAIKFFSPLLSVAPSHVVSLNPFQTSFHIFCFEVFSSSSPCWTLNKFFLTSLIHRLLVTWLVSNFLWTKVNFSSRTCLSTLDHHGVWFSTIQSTSRLSVQRNLPKWLGWSRSFNKTVYLSVDPVTDHEAWVEDIKKVSICQVWTGWLLRHILAKFYRFSSQ